MSRFALFYNISVASGVMLTAAGVHQVLGLGWALIAAGLMVTGLAIYSGWLVSRAGA